jgi:hypothetical protein
MALTATIVYVDANSAIYKVENTGSPLGTSVDITMTGAATLDLVTDGANNSFTGQGFGGRLKQVARAGLDGLGSQAAAGWTQAEARDLLFSDGSTLAGGPLMPRAKCFLTERAGVNFDIEVEADVAVGVPLLRLIATATPGVAYLHVQLKHSIAP